MSKKSWFRLDFGERHGEREQALLIYGREYLYHSYWSLWTELGMEKISLTDMQSLKSVC